MTQKIILTEVKVSKDQTPTCRLPLTRVKWKTRVFLCSLKYLHHTSISNTHSGTILVCIRTISTDRVSHAFSSVGHSVHFLSLRLSSLDIHYVNNSNANKLLPVFWNSSKFPSGIPSHLQIPLFSQHLWGSLLLLPLTEVWFLSSLAAFKWWLFCLFPAIL